MRRLYSSPSVQSYIARLPRRIPAFSMRQIIRREMRQYTKVKTVTRAPAGEVHEGNGRRDAVSLQGSHQRSDAQVDRDQVVQDRPRRQGEGILQYEARQPEGGRRHAEEARPQEPGVRKAQPPRRGRTAL